MTKLMTVFLATLIIGLPWAAAADKFEGAPIPDKLVWKGGSYVKGTEGITAARRDADWVTFDVGSGSYRFGLKGKQ